jgi:glycosyltransferase involved in cell wall biosynthesis
MHVLQVSDSLAVRYGGTAAACAQLSNRLAAQGVTVSVVTLEGGGADREWTLDPHVVARRCRVLGPRRIGYAPGLWTVLEPLAPPHVVHLHGLWRMHYVQAARFASRRRIPVILSAHGMLHQAALARKAGLKKLARRAFQDAAIRGARAIHAASDDEADQIRRAGFAGPVAVIPWGVELPPSPAPPRPRDIGTRQVLYLGRLHPGKGLETLLGAWARIGAGHESWRLVLAGYGDRAYRTTLERLAADLGMSRTVTFAGGADGDRRETLFAGASLVVVPSPAENFGFVVPEALARSVPVVATQGAPWSALAERACGWWVSADEASLAAALHEALGQTPERLREMGDRGRQLVADRFTWERSAGRMQELYDWACARGPQPAFVRSALDPSSAPAGARPLGVTPS